MLSLASLLLFASLTPCDGPPSANKIRHALDGTTIAWLKAATVQRLEGALVLEVSFKNSPIMLRRTLPANGSCETLAQAVAVTILGLDLTLSHDPASLGLPTCIVELSPSDAHYLLWLAFRPADDMPFESRGAARIVNLIQWARSQGEAFPAPSDEPPGARPRIAPSAYSRPTAKLGPVRACKPRFVVRPSRLD